MGKVVEFNGITRLDIDPQKVLGRALGAELEGVVIMGYTKEGEEFFASSYADGGLVLWLMEHCKQKLLDVGKT